MAEEFRRSVELAPPRGTAMWNESRAAALLATHANDGAILEVLRQKWASLESASQRTQEEAFDRAQLAAARGRLDEAPNRLAAADSLLAEDPERQSHQRIAILRCQVAEELEQHHLVGKLAADYLAKRDGWRAPRLDIIDGEKIPFLRVMVHHRLAPAHELEKSRNAWLETHDREDLYSWMILSANATTTAEEGKTAIRSFEALTNKTRQTDLVFALGQIGHAYFLANEPAKAVGYLDRAARDCSWLNRPIAHTRTLFELGSAQEALGRTEAACAAFERVLERWRSGPSVTRREGEHHAQKLGCALRK